MKRLFAVFAGLMLAGCGANSPSFQSETTVLGLEIETMGSALGGETPMPKLRAGLIRHKGQIVQKAQAARLYTEATDINLFAASGSARTEMTVE